MKVEAAYAQWSTSYDTDRNLTRDLDQQVTREVLHDLRPGGTLELGCGTGKNTVFLAQISDRLQALDFSEKMIAKAREKVPAANVTFEIADISQPWPCADNSIELVTCNLVLEHLEDLNFIFAEAARVLTGNGKLFVSELHPFRQYQGVLAHFTRGQQRTEIPAFVHHISDFLKAAETNGFSLLRLRESWHEEDENKPPRLIAFLFHKPGK